SMSASPLPLSPWERVPEGRVRVAAPPITPRISTGTSTAVASAGVLFGSRSARRVSGSLVLSAAAPGGAGGSARGGGAWPSGERIRGQGTVHPADAEGRAIARHGQRDGHVGLLAPHRALGVTGGLPKLDRPILGQRDEPRAVGRERQPHDRPLVRESRLDHGV